VSAESPADVAFAKDAVQSARAAPLARRFKLEYGAGAVANGVVTAGLAFFLLFYLTAVGGLSGTLAGLAQLVALLIDAIADPAIGLASDRVRSRLGRRLPFMIASLAPFAGGFGLLFSIPVSLSGVELFLYVTVCLIVVRLSLSCFVLPFTAVGAEATDNYHERANIVAYRLSFENVGVLCAVVLGLGVFMSGPTGLLVRHNYLSFAWTCAAVVALTGLLAIAAVRRELNRLHGAKPEQAPFLASFVREFTELLRNRSFLALFATVLIYFIAYCTAGALALHASRYFWRLDSFATQLVLLSPTLGPLLGAPISTFALHYVEKRTLSICAFMGIALFMVWPALFQLYGPFSLNPAAAAVTLSVNGVLLGTAIMAGGIGFQSMLADTADEHEWLFGVRREGLFFSGLTLAYKAAAGLGGLIAGVALDVIHFPVNLAAHGSAATIPNDVLEKLALISGPLPALFVAISPLFLFGYHLTRKKHRQVIAELEQRNTGKSDVR
jgi:GPH family glycoside/pentoside/hexuronide:cation symporter